MRSTVARSVAAERSVRVPRLLPGCVAGVCPISHRCGYGSNAMCLSGFQSVVADYGGPPPLPLLPPLSLLPLLPLLPPAPPLSDLLEPLFPGEPFRS